MTQDVFKIHLNSCEYDKMYQDIEYIEMIGYSQSFKIAELGGIVTGMDRSSIVLETTEMLNEVYGSQIKTKVWVGGDPIGDGFDVALCLNMLHHCGDEENTLKNMTSKFAIFEVKYDQSFLISQYFDIIKKVQSHRVGRIILLGVRREL